MSSSSTHLCPLCKSQCYISTIVESKCVLCDEDLIYNGKPLQLCHKCAVKFQRCALCSVKLIEIEQDK